MILKDESSLAVGVPVTTSRANIVPVSIVAVLLYSDGAGELERFLASISGRERAAYIILQERGGSKINLPRIQRQTTLSVVKLRPGLLLTRNWIYVVEGPGQWVLNDKLTFEKKLRHGKESGADGFLRSLASSGLPVVVRPLRRLENEKLGAGTVVSIMGVFSPARRAAKTQSQLPLFPKETSSAFGLVGRQIMPAARLSTSPGSADASGARPVLSGRRKILHAQQGLYTPAISHALPHRLIGEKGDFSPERVAVSYARTSRAEISTQSVLAGATAIRLVVPFSDPNYWAALQREVLVPLISQLDQAQPFRAWVAAVGEGSDAYTLAILIVETLAALGRVNEFKVFATDTDPVAIARARIGHYPAGLKTISVERLGRFFNHRGAYFHVKKFLRDRIVFAQHNVVTDPPFSHLNLCGCRNLPMESATGDRRRALEMIHYGLQPDGIFFADNGETLLGCDDLYRKIKRHNFFRRVARIGKGAFFPLPKASPRAVPAPVVKPIESGGKLLRERRPSARPGALPQKAKGMDEVTLQQSLQSLEATREELQTLNDELLELNGRLEAKVSELEQVNYDIRRLLNNTALGVIFIDRELKLQRYTAAVQDLVTITSADIGRPLADLPFDFSDPTLSTDIRNVLESQGGRDHEVTTRSGQIYLRRALPYWNEARECDGVVLTFTEIGARKNAESNLRKVEENCRVILEGIRDYAIFLLNANGEIITWTAAAEQMLGFNAGEAIGATLDIFSTPEDRVSGSVKMEITLAKNAGAATDNRWQQRKDHSQFWGTGTLFALKHDDGSLRGFVKVLRDNTAQKRADEALVEAKRAAEQANEAKDDFLANVSHELRTPLAALLLWVKLIADGTEEVPASMREGLESIQRCAEEQQELIEDLVDTSRIVAGKLRLELRTIDFGLTVREAVETIRPTARAHGLTLHEDFDEGIGLVRADSHRLYQTLWNLLSNAVKFTPSGGRISVSAKRQGEQVVVKIKDTGVGIAPEFLTKVFERFRQADTSSARLHTGLGLGLAISKQIVELHGGRISAESAGLGRGSTFTMGFILPKVDADPVESTASNSPFDPRGLLAGAQILLVEDAIETRQALTAILKAAGAKISPAGTAAAGLELHQRKEFTVILSDIGLPQVDGHEFIQRIRRQEKILGRLETPALALTAFADERNRCKALQSGFSLCMTKPVDPRKLILALQELAASA